jgi:micrococcal nuclease
MLLIVAAVLVLLVAWRWPAVVRRVAAHPSLAFIPAVLRASPMRLAGAVAAALVVIAALASAGSPPALADDASEPPESPRAQATASPTPTANASATLASTPIAQPTAEAPPTPTAAPTAAFGLAPTGPMQVATVASVTDGDTIRVLLDGQNVPVRYIGIDTPETQDGAEPMGAEASEANRRLVEGQQVVLETDVSETDQYGRLLRYVWIEADAGWLLVNLELVRQGLATVVSFPPDVKYHDALLLPAQGAARDAGLGMWSLPSPSPTGRGIVPLIPQGNCEPSYPDFCLAIGTSDLDCGDVEWRRFTVLGTVANPDPHRFDGNADGVGCESP